MGTNIAIDSDTFIDDLANLPVQNVVFLYLCSMEAMAQLYFDDLPMTDCDSPCRKLFITTFRWSNMTMENPPCIDSFPITPGNLTYLLRMARKIVELPIRHGDFPNKHLSFTSSTAQGGGGSVKNRKPIGELGCCESGMAERIHWWTERCLRSPLFLSLFLTIYLSI